MTTTRVLISMRRRPGAEDSARYEEAWGELRAAAQAWKAHAWRFRAADDDGLFMEFLEFRAADDPRSDQRVADALSRLERIAIGTVEEWMDAEEPRPEEK